MTVNLDPQPEEEPRPEWAQPGVTPQPWAAVRVDGGET